MKIQTLEMKKLLKLTPLLMRYASMDGPSLIKSFNLEGSTKLGRKLASQRQTFRVSELITHRATPQWKMISRRIHLRKSVISADRKDTM
jgi:hypothetical protein